MSRIKQARRPATDVHGVHDRTRYRVGNPHTGTRVKPAVTSHLSAHRVHIRREPCRRHNSSVEVAIRAFRLTKRDLYVDSKRIHAKIVAHRTESAVSPSKHGGLGILTRLFSLPPALSPKPFALAARQTRTKISPARSPEPASCSPQKSSSSSPSSPSLHASPYSLPHADTDPYAAPCGQISPPGPTPRRDRRAR